MGSAALRNNCESDPSDAAFALVTSTVDARIRETTTVGSLVATSITLFPVVSPSTVKVRSVEFRPTLPKKNQAELFADSPLKGLNLNVERDPDYGRDVEL
jgi:hypothetical protein